MREGRRDRRPAEVGNTNSSGPVSGGRQQLVQQPRSPCAVRRGPGLADGTANRSVRSTSRHRRAHQLADPLPRDCQSGKHRTALDVPGRVGGASRSARLPRQAAPLLPRSVEEDRGARCAPAGLAPRGVAAIRSRSTARSRIEQSSVRVMSIDRGESGSSSASFAAMYCSTSSSVIWSASLLQVGAGAPKAAKRSLP